MLQLRRDGMSRFRIPTLVAALLVIPTIVIEESGLPDVWQAAASV